MRQEGTDHGGEVGGLWWSMGCLVDCFWRGFWLCVCRRHAGDGKIGTGPGGLGIVLLLCFALPVSAVAQDAVSRTGYVLATGDVIYVRVYDEDDLSMRLAVPGDGTVRYAFVGDFQLAGKTIDQVEQEITQRSEVETMGKTVRISSPRKPRTD